jgi:hypothetical protein
MRSFPGCFSLLHLIALGVVRGSLDLGCLGLGRMSDLGLVHWSRPADMGGELGHAFLDIGVRKRVWTGGSGHKVLADHVVPILFTPDPAGQQHVLLHDGCPLCMDGAQVGVLEEPYEIGLCCFLDGQECLTLDPEVALILDEKRPD